MHIPGHLAVALAEHRLLTRFGPDKQLPLRPLLLASYFPDVVDKTIGYVFHLMPNGRHFAHNIFALFGLSLAVTLMWGSAAGRAWFMGYLGHLLADDVRQVPWFFPVKAYHFYPGKLKFKLKQLAREMIFLAIVLLIYRLEPG
ncbi:MAG: metal-dependent hydrolase [Anaerolineae bacterium]|nr:metal-dependent hydrolase [Anaerolineae bacterium]